MTEKLRINSDLAEELVWCGKDALSENGEWLHVSEEVGDSGRWRQNMSTIIERIADGTFWSIDWQSGLTEYCDPTYPWKDGPTVEVYRVWPKQVTMTTWVTKEPHA